MASCLNYSSTYKLRRFAGVSTAGVRSRNPERSRGNPRNNWRRERDSNPRYGFPYSGFKDIWIETVLSRIKSLQEGAMVRKWNELALIRQLLFPSLFPRLPMIRSLVTNGLGVGAAADSF